MYKDQYILCIIPARGGSKRLPGKHIKLIGGIPLIGYGIKAAKQSKYIDRLIISTDDEAIAKVAREEGAEVPFMRPAELATDEAPTLPVLQHGVTEIEKQGKKIDAVVLIQPTVPGIELGDVDGAIEKFFESGANSCISVCEIIDPPEWMYRMREGGMLEKYISAADARTQDLEKLYRVNGAVYVSKRELLMEKNKIVDQANCASIIMPRDRSLDIDTQTDFDMAEMLLTKQK